jgi:hypothetical protein
LHAFGPQEKHVKPLKSILSRKLCLIEGMWVRLERNSGRYLQQLLANFVTSDPTESGSSLCMLQQCDEKEGLRIACTIHTRGKVVMVLHSACDG